LRKAAFNVLVTFLTPDQIGYLKDEFYKVDTDYSGFIELDELEEALTNATCTINHDGQPAHSLTT